MAKAPIFKGKVNKSKKRVVKKPKEAVRHVPATGR
jgi:hypothetical protein